MKLSFTTFSTQDKTITEAVQIACGQKLDGIELRGRDRIHVSPSCDFTYVSELKRLIAGKGLEIPCLTAYTKFRQSSLQDVYREVDELMPMVSLAEYLGAGTIRVFMGPVPESLDLSQSDRIARDGLLYAAKCLNGSPVRLVIETHDSVKDGKTLRRLLDGVPDSIGVLLDIIHPWDQGESIEMTWQLIGSRIYHVHIKDITDTVASGRIYCRIGAGLLPVEETVAYLNQHGYDGFYSLEWEPSADPDRGVSFADQLDSFVQILRRQ